MERLWSWMKSHPATTVIIALSVALSIFIEYYPTLSEPYSSILGLFYNKNVSATFLYFLFLILFSGVEVSIGTVNYVLWMIFSGSFLYLFRKVVSYKSYGPSYAVFCPFVSFALMHEADLRISLLRIHFTDTAFYVIAIIEFAFFDIPGLALDFAGCLASNLLYKGIRFISKLMLSQGHQEHERVADQNDGLQNQLLN